MNKKNASGNANIRIFSNSAIARMEGIVNRRNKNKLDVQKIISIVASLAIVVALVAGIVSIIKSSSSGKNKNYIDFNVAQETTTPKEKPTVKPTEKPTKKPEQVTTEVPATTPAPKESEMAAVTVPDETIAVNSPVYSFSEKSSLLWPVEGDIILGYNMDKTIYFPTLDIYRCNPAVVISAEVGEPVMSSAPGVVEEIYTDSEIGTAVKVSVGNGYEVIYGQLSNLQVGVSEHIEAGRVIGYATEPTKYYSKEGTNVYFKLMKEGAAVDPMLYLIEK